jgi:hypothetical protein
VLRCQHTIQGRTDYAEASPRCAVLVSPRAWETSADCTKNALDRLLAGFGHAGGRKRRDDYGRVHRPFQHGASLPRRLRRSKIDPHLLIFDSLKWALIKSSLILGNDLSKMDDLTLSILSNQVRLDSSTLSSAQNDLTKRRLRGATGHHRYPSEPSRRSKPPVAHLGRSRSGPDLEGRLAGWGVRRGDRQLYAQGGLFFLPFLPSLSI